GAIDRGPRRELAGIDRLLQPVEIDHHVVEPVGFVEATLRQPAVERRLAALEAVEGDPGAGGLTLAAAGAGLALARADAPADALGPVMGAGIVADFVELHGIGSPIPRPAPDA